MITTDFSKYRLLRALRPFSFSVALITCLVGIVAASGTDNFNPFTAVIILSAALVLQAGVNLINDFSDLNELADQQIRALIRRNFRYGLGCFVAATALGLYLVAQVGAELLLLFLLGLGGALGYTLEPVNFKRRGLAVVLVFWLMGVLMVAGSYYIMTDTLTAAIVWQSVPVSLITSLLLLANELRDEQSDRQSGIGTLTVRIGYRYSNMLFMVLLVAVFFIAGGLWWSGLLQSGWWLLSVPLALWLWLRLRSGKQLETLPPLTGRFFLLFGLLYCVSL